MTTPVNNNLSHETKPNNEHRQRIKHSKDQAEKYLRRKPAKHIAEMALLNRALRSLHFDAPKGDSERSFLDAPCGVGRATIFLAEKGYVTTGVDLGEGALEIAKQQIAQSSAHDRATVAQADLLALPYPDQNFDAVLCFRLIHHLPTPEHRQEIIKELCRVAGSYVLISYLSPWSVTSAKRLLRQKLFGEQSVQHLNSLAEIESYFAPQGFKLDRDIAQTPLIHSLHIAIFKRG
jgi:2-polyprenyl-3-methyl-5-hydroxy-6-metoxy-1,4-benzoquinol methylase